MAITVEATYENGVLKPAHPLPLNEHERVQVTVETQAPPAANSGAGPRADAPGGLTLGERLAALARDLPQEVIDSLPVDGASQHDHYIYGTPKRTE